jgi:hypothetical protein
MATANRDQTRHLLQIVGIVLGDARDSRAGIRRR